MSALSASLVSLAGVALKRSPGLKAGAHLPAIRVARTVTIDPRWSRDYRRLVGDVDVDGPLPVCAPQVLAVGLHLAILGDRRFPLSALGVVHVRNRIEALEAINDDATLALAATLSDDRRTERGIEFDITTEATVGAKVVWRSVMTALSRQKSSSSSSSSSGAGASSKQAGEHGPVTPLLASSVVRVPADMGRRYAQVAGDANPIHLTTASARLFGFKRAIAHGMWTLQRSLSEVQHLVPVTGIDVDVRFIRPVFLPSSVVISARNVANDDGDGDGEGIAVDVDPLRRGAPHVRTVVRRR